MSESAFGVLDQLYFRYAPGVHHLGIEFVNSSLESRDDESALVRLLNEHLPIESGASPEPEFLYDLLTDDTAFLLRLSAGRRLGAHVLVGDRRVLDSRTAMIAMRAFGWSSAEPDRTTSMRRIRVTAIHRLHSDSDFDQRGSGRRARKAFIESLLDDLRNSRTTKRLTIVGCPPESKFAVLWALRPTSGLPLHGMQAWTFATHESMLAPTAQVPDVLLLSRPLPPSSPAMRPTDRLVATFDDSTPPSNASQWLRNMRWLIAPPLDPEPLPPRPSALHKAPPSSQPALPSVPGPARATAPPAGWYRTPEQPEHHWWDGGNWTGQQWTSPSTVFVSYARQDEAAVSAVVADLRAARLTVWFDQEIETGQQWWDEIISRIRGAAVLLHAVSNSSLASEPCELERSYAEKLGVPVVPVMVDEADLRSSPYGARQVIDYRRVDRLRSARMIADVMRAMQQRSPLPSPLPAPPPAPFHFLVDLSATLREPTLSREEQLRMFDQIVDRRRTARDPSVLRRLDELLRELGDRHDALHSVANLVEQKLGG